MARKKAGKGGRPSKFSDEMCEQVTKLCRLGATDKELADFFNVSVPTIDTWKKQNPEFLGAVKKGKTEADANVSDRLYCRAMGYTHPEEKIFCQNGEVTRVSTTKHYPPDTMACIYWLNNRRRDDWRQRHEVTGKDGAPLLTPVINVVVGNKPDAAPEAG